MMYIHMYTNFFFINLSQSLDAYVLTGIVFFFFLHSEVYIIFVKYLPDTACNKLITLRVRKKSVIAC